MCNDSSTSFFFFSQPIITCWSHYCLVPIRFVLCKEFKMQVANRKFTKEEWIFSCFLTHHNTIMRQSSMNFKLIFQINQCQVSKTVLNTYKFLTIESVTDTPQSGHPVTVSAVKNMEMVALSFQDNTNQSSHWLSTELDIKKSVVRGDFEGPISSGYLAHCSHPFSMSIRIEFLASYSMLSRSLVTLTSLARLFINPEFCQCPQRRLCQLQLFWYLQQIACFCCIGL